MSLLITYVFNWHALTDACPKCKALSVKEWRESELYRGTLWDPIWGDIWDLNAGHSLAHPNCRCQLAVRVEGASTGEFEALLALMRELKGELQQLLNEAQLK